MTTLSHRVFIFRPSKKRRQRNCKVISEATAPWASAIMGRCYDFQNIFAAKFGEKKLAFFVQNIVLVFAKLES
jgi:hypothetical protein